MAKSNDVKRQTMGTSDLRPKAAPVLRGTLKKKGDTKSGKADNAGTATNRRDVLLTENMGARFGVFGVNMNALPGSNPEAAATQANGRIVRSNPSRLGSFGEGASFASAG
jgi:hypothetical protein